MKVVPLRSPGPVYSGWAYLLLGEWNRLEDVNTLVDTGTDGGILDMLPSVNTGIGKQPVDMILLTHSHFDHAGGVPRITAAFGCPVGGMAPTDGVTRLLHDGEVLRVADREAEVMACPEHSMDSMCLYVHGEGAVFTGDTPLFLHSAGGTYCEDYLHLLRRLHRLPVRSIYPGHDVPILEGASQLIESTLRLLEKSTIQNRSRG